MGLREMVWERLGMPAYRAEQLRKMSAWDYAQADDTAIRDTDPLAEEVREAALLLDRDPERAFYQLLVLAQQGSVWSMVNVGWCSETGCGTPASLADAEYWYRRAHEAGCNRATIDYGRLLRHRGATELERKVYAAGVERGWAPALYRAAVIGLRGASTIAERLEFKLWLERAAELGSPAAQLTLARCSLRGEFGLRHFALGIRMAWALLRAVWSEQPSDRDGQRETPRSQQLH